MVNGENVNTIIRNEMIDNPVRSNNNLSDLIVFEFRNNSANAWQGFLKYQLYQ